MTENIDDHAYCYSTVLPSYSMLLKLCELYVLLVSYAPKSSPFMRPQETTVR